MRAVGVLALWVVASCSGRVCSSSALASAPTYGTHELLASLRRTGCMGQCPAYRVTVYRDGTVEYVGEAHVKTVGRVRGEVARPELEKLEALFEVYRYLELDDEYDDRDFYDTSWAITTYRRSECTTKRIDHYHGDEDAPDALRYIEEGTDRIVRSERWVGTLDERRSMRR